MALHDHPRFAPLPDSRAEWGDWDGASSEVLVATATTEVPVDVIWTAEVVAKAGNHNGVRDVPPAVEEADVASWVTARDWMDDAIGQGPYPLICMGTLVNVGSEWDWTRYFWDMYTDESVSYSQLINLYDEMNPRTFDPNGGTPSTADDPVTRLNAAANALGLSAKHNNQKDNGVHH